MNREVIITCAVTGAGDTVGRHPAIPVTPTRDRRRRARGGRGRGGDHPHPRPRSRDRQGRRASPHLYREVVERIRARNAEVILNLTAGMGGDFVPDPERPWQGGPGTDMATVAERLAHVEELHARDLHARLRQHELRPERLSQHAGHAARDGGQDQSRRRQARDRSVRARPRLDGQAADRGGPDREPADVPALHRHPVRRRVRPAGDPGDARSACPMPRSSPPSGSAACRCRWSPRRSSSAATCGSGLEDNLWLDKGVPASNGALVARAKQIVELLGARVLGPDEAREHLQLRPRLSRAPMNDIRKVALIGAGVIGAGWAARLVLNGIDVTLDDPDPEAERKVERRARQRRARLAQTHAARQRAGERSPSVATSKRRQRTPTSSRRTRPSART